ncbi:hypothetical protein D5366_00900 [Neokomagataea tanensis]|uniref:Uncharacterized protein n=1 Tax=Neokomagataea tanensis TaxID=661191 RepID=A0A4Y6V6E2_9PROT|nr:hypothetical protein D5366_00900 [Neokomagataea tanensis]
MLEALSDVLTSLLFSASSYRGEKLLGIKREHCRILRLCAWPMLVLGLVLHLVLSQTIGFALVCWVFGISLSFGINGAALGCVEHFKSPPKKPRKRS